MEHVCKKKVGEMHACGAACGAILGGGSEEEIEKLRKYGLHVGMIQGMMMMVNGLGRKEEREMEVVERLKVLALKELESFDAKKVDLISSLVESNLCNV
ncbi:heterodimeric geranylgeranyl pyrophosphate synthase small subunit, chloroplastic-like [Camellia sinensis]|nr:heterodimeric geranylgeranyl pyrophosphate synthase small subunit, chloroplastic-like [Camellia sinensis]